MCVTNVRQSVARDEIPSLTTRAVNRWLTRSVGLCASSVTSASTAKTADERMDRRMAGYRLTALVLLQPLDAAA